MTGDPHLGDRHLRPDASGALLDAKDAYNGVVRIVVPEAMASTQAGQHAAWMLVNQLVRQDRLVTRIYVEAPDVPLLDRILPFGHAATLSAGLTDWARQAVGDRVTVDVHHGRGISADVEIHIGQVESDAAAARRLGIFGEGWNVYVGSPDSVPRHVPSDPNPLGPYFAASIAAGETFKHLRGINPDRGGFIERLAYSLLDLRSSGTWNELPTAPLPNEIQLAHPYLIGAGAVGQAFALALGAVPGIRGHVTVLDPQRLDDITNLNRYGLSRLDDFQQRRAKVGIAADFLRARGLSIHPAHMTWQAFLRRMNTGDQLPELIAREREYRFDLLLSCVDDTDGNLARHAIQNVWPRTLIGASTHGDGLRATVSNYVFHSGGMCLKCHNPIRDSRKVLEELVGTLRKMPADERVRWVSENGLSVKEVEEALHDPGCASVGMRQLSDYVSRPGDPQFSVGFTSIGAGIILAAQLLKLSIGQDAFPPGKSSSHFFYFLNPGARWVHQGPSPTCNCQTEGQKRYRQLWGVH